GGLGVVGWERGKSGEKGEVGGRGWAVVPGGTGVAARRLTDRGQLLVNLRNQSQAFAQSWFDKLSSGQTASAYFDLLDPGERKKGQADLFVRVAGFGAFNVSPPGGCSGLAPLLANTRLFLSQDWALTVMVPGSGERADKLVQIDERRLREEGGAAREAVPATMKLLLRRSEQPHRYASASVEQTCARRPAAVFAGNRVQFAHDCQIALPPYKCDAIVTVESTPGYEDRTK